MVTPSKMALTGQYGVHCPQAIQSSLMRIEPPIKVDPYAGRQGNKYLSTCVLLYLCTYLLTLDQAHVFQDWQIASVLAFDPFAKRRAVHPSFGQHLVLDV